MTILLFLARAFVQTFGITEPSPEQERRAAYFIGSALALVALGVVLCVVAFI